MNTVSIFGLLWGCIVYMVLYSLIPNLTILKLITSWQSWVLLIMPIVIVYLPD